MTSFDGSSSHPPDGSTGSSVPTAPRTCCKLRGSIADRAHARPPRRAQAVGTAAAGRAGPRARRAVAATRRCRWSAPGLKAIYLSGWQVAADANAAGAMYPDQSLYPANTGPELAKKINRTLAARRPDRASRRRREARLVRADRRRCRSRLRRAAELLRDHEGLYRGGRRRRSFRGPARVARRSAATWAARC